MISCLHRPVYCRQFGARQQINGLQAEDAGRDARTRPIRRSLTEDDAQTVLQD